MNREQDWTTAPVIWEKVRPLDRGNDFSAMSVSSSLLTDFEPDTPVELLDAENWLVLRSRIRQISHDITTKLRRITAPFRKIRRQKHTEKPDWRKMSVVHVTGHRSDGRGLDGPVNLTIGTFPPHRGRLQVTSDPNSKSLCLDDGQTIIRVWGENFHVTPITRSEAAPVWETETEREEVQALVPST
ncbi:MAG TPA: hypothetical protein PLV72_00775 [Candidatus Magasanikbacteria bacterium]|nr:hypothetical protein [Candidatus Magasanikbacteria bacterium]